MYTYPVTYNPYDSASAVEGKLIICVHTYMYMYVYTYKCECICICIYMYRKNEANEDENLVYDR